MRVLATIGFVIGCGRIGFDPRSGDGGSGSDGIAVMADSFATGAFGTPALIVELSSTTALDDDPSLTDDLLELYFNSDRLGGTGGGDIWASRRVDATAVWDAPQPVAELNTAADESTPKVSTDGLTIWFSSRRPGGAGEYDVYRSVRSSRALPWEAPVRVPELCSTAQDTAPHLAAQGLLGYFSSLRGGGEYDIWVAARTTTADPWSGPTVVTELMTANYDGDVWVDVTATRMFFGRGPGSSALDVWSATRATPDESWGSLVTVDELNTPQTDGDPWLSADGRTMYFVSSRNGTFDLFVTSR